MIEFSTKQSFLLWNVDMDMLFIMCKFATKLRGVLKLLIHGSTFRKIYLCSIGLHHMLVIPSALGYRSDLLIFFP